jgi:predicted acetyltransferase
MDLTLRPLDPAEVDAFIDLDDAAFSVRSDPTRRAASAATIEWPRTLAAFEPDGTLCGVVGANSQTLTLPGGARVPVAGVTAVGVLPTHRRRGVLTSLMASQLDDVADRGEALAVLNASEATIYRRFGYGVATRLAFATVDAERAAFATAAPGEWWLRLVDDAEGVELAPAMFDAHVASRPGGLTRPDAFWPAIFSTSESWVGGGEHFTVVCGRAGGPACGYAMYKVKRATPAGHWTTVTSEVIAADPDAEAVLWRFLLDIDLTSSLEVEGGPVDGALRWRLVDERAYRVTSEFDFLWVRVVDPVAALGARGYGAPGELVIELVDDFRPATAGRYRLSVGTDASGAVAAPVAARTEDRADLAMDVADLGAIYLGGARPSTLGAAGRIVEVVAGALAAADRMFAAERVPFCLTHF